MKVRNQIQRLIAAGNSQTEIARKCKLSNATIGKILYTDTKQTLDTIQKIAVAYNLPMADLLDDYTNNLPNGSAKFKTYPATSSPQENNRETGAINPVVAMAMQDSSFSRLPVDEQIALIYKWMRSSAS